MPDKDNHKFTTHTMGEKQHQAKQQSANKAQRVEGDLGARDEQ